MSPESIELKRIADSMEKIEHALRYIGLALAELVNRTPAIPIYQAQLISPPMPYQNTDPVLPSNNG